MQSLAQHHKCFSWGVEAPQECPALGPAVPTVPSDVLVTVCELTQLLLGRVGLCHLYSSFLIQCTQFITLWYLKTAACPWNIGVLGFSNHTRETRSSHSPFLFRDIHFRNLYKADYMNSSSSRLCFFFLQPHRPASHALESYTALPYNKRSPCPSNPVNRPAYQGSNPISDVWAIHALRIVAKYLKRYHFPNGLIP